MTLKRVYTVFALFALAANVLMIRLFFIISNESYAAEAAAQSSYTKTVAVSRPDFYDINGLPLTGTSRSESAVVFPGQSAGNLLTGYIAEENVDFYKEALLGSTPFAVKLVNSIPKEIPVTVFETKERYSSDALARHLIGYLDYSGGGVSGLEFALEEYFEQHLTETRFRVSVNANREIIESVKAVIFDEGGENEGVTLTLDRRIQFAAERIADESFERGAIVVLDCASGEVRAMVSRPNFDQNDIAAAIAREDACLINRAVSAYSLGSVYKPVIAAAALEAGLGDFLYECTGTIEVNENSYSCNEGKAHGELDMKTALTHSCNTYFIALGQRLGGEAIYNMAASFGFGGNMRLGEGYCLSAGNMPYKRLLINEESELINHCFGQGKLLASPLQVAAYMNCIATGGLFFEPSVVKAVGSVEAEPREPHRVMSEDTASRLTEYLRSVTENGTGELGQPQYLSASGKTGTAQTGRYNADGSEAVIGWFSGFFPSESPRYVITVMVENEGYGYMTAAPVFKQLADFITVYEQVEIP